MILVGFTGTRDRMTYLQRESLRVVLAEFASPAGVELHHGDCVGADAEAAWIARAFGFRVVCHPPTDDSRRAFAPSDVTLPAEPFLSRNRAIVDACAVLVAAPSSFGEQYRSGTWSTVRYARRVGRRTVVVRPDGSVVRERWYVVTEGRIP